MEHLPVMYAEALQHLAIKKNGIYIDCTFGRGGHSQGILAALGTDGQLIAFDRDLDAVNSDYAKNLIKDHRFKLIHSSFSQLEAQLDDLSLIGKIDGILMDLGVSSPQLDNPERGFSFLREGFLVALLNDYTEKFTHGIPAPMSPTIMAAPKVEIVAATNEDPTAASEDWS